MADERLTFTIAAIDKTKAAFTAIKGRIGSLQTAIAGLAIGAGLKKFAGEIDNLAKSSSKLGLTVNQLQSLQFAGELTGVSADKLTQGLARFSKGISEAAAGTGTAKKAFDDLGISITDSEGNIKSTDRLLAEVSDGLTKTGSSADKVRVAFDLFGRSGVDMINTLSGGSKALADMRGEFNNLTFELTTEQAKAVELANDTFSRLGTTLSSIGQQITAEFLPKLARATASIVSFVLRAYESILQFKKDVFDPDDPSDPVAQATESVYNFMTGTQKEVHRGRVTIENFNEALKQSATTAASSLDEQIAKVTAMREAWEAAANQFDNVGETVNNTGAAAEKTTKKFANFSDLVKHLTTTTMPLIAEGAKLSQTLGGVDDIFEKNLQAEKEQIEAVHQLTLEWDQLNGGLLVGTENLDDFVRGADLTKTKLQEFAESASTLHDTLQNTAVDTLESFEDAFVGIVRGTTSAKDAFKSMANSIIDDLIRMQVRKSITAPLGGFLDKILGDVFGPGGGIGGGIPGNIPGKALGGPVMGSTPYIVGERGPELFVPGTSGRIIPNNAMRNAQGGGQTTIVNQTIQIETGVSQTVRAEILNLLPQIKEQTKAAVLDSRLRGGQFAAAFR